MLKFYNSFITSALSDYHLPISFLLVFFIQHCNFSTAFCCLFSISLHCSHWFDCKWIAKPVLVRHLYCRILTR